MLLRDATLGDGQVADVRIRDGVIDAIGLSLAADAGEESIDLTGHRLLTAFAEPHAHLDKAFLSERITNATGDLMGAIRGMQANRHLITLDDTIERAERAVRLLIGNGTTLIRSHADTTHENLLMSVEALVEVRKRVAGLCDLQIVSLVSWPISGAAGAPSRDLLRAALEAGADIVGGAPHLDDDPHGANEELLAIAAEYGRDVDLHTDETLNAGILALEDLARRVIDSGFQHRVTASHCVSLGMQSLERQQAVSELVAAAGISVVALPHTNLFLQGREQQCAMPRAVTAVKALRAAGVNLCAGADNLQDPFNPMGRGDPLETAGLMVMAAHLLPDDALASVSTASHIALTGESPSVTVGSRAELVAVPATTVREAIAFGPASRIVIHDGHVVNR